ncbi:hypothetical protein KPL71_007756 [Citrus sinensis]|uniref:Uncharacterized protein n=1 Tax=Citrus sinensis TaxID=2711 RepID=A0ACB8M1Q1_CITSI|nr:hypothetical protein KPL71_007756 [Citrus sinensis]
MDQFMDRFERFVANVARSEVEVRTVIVGNKDMVADLIPSDIHDFDAILGMDWLVNDHATVDFFWKELDRFTFLGHVIFANSIHMDPQKIEAVVNWERLTRVSKTDWQSKKVILNLEDMLRGCGMQFRGNCDMYLPLMEFTYNNNYQSSIQMEPFKALYGKKWRTLICWDEVRERQFLGLEMVQSTNEKINVIREKLKAAQDKQKSYADKRQRPLEFTVGDKVFLRISPWMGIIRFGKRGKLSPRYISLYEIIQRVGPIEYHLALSQELSRVHDVFFYVSMLRKYIPDPSHVLNAGPFQMTADLIYEVEPVQILDQK